MRVKALIVLALFALPLGGCGGGGEGEGESASTATAATSPAATHTAQGQESAAPSRPGASAPREPIGDPSRASRRTPGSKAVAPEVPVTPRGDNSIQVFGTEGEEGEANRALGSLRAYLSARLAGDWAGACEAASAQFKEELAKLVEQAKAKPEAEKPEGCAQALEMFLGAEKASAIAMPERVLSFRVDRPYAYLIFEDAEGAVRFVAMADDQGQWKVNVPEASELSVSQGGAPDAQR